MMHGKVLLLPSFLVHSDNRVLVMPLFFFINICYTDEQKSW